MTLSRDDLQRQLQTAREELAAWNKVLDGRDVSSAQREDDPKWRQYHARVNQVEARLRTVGQVETIDAERETRKAEKAAAAAEPAESKPRGKGKGKGKQEPPAKKEKKKK